MWGFLEKTRYPILSLLVGAVLLFLAYYQVLDLKKFQMAPYPNPNLPVAVVGVLLIVASVAGAAGGVLGELYSIPVLGRVNLRRIEGGYAVRLGNAMLHVVYGQIEAIDDQGGSTMVVLPANEFFDDECITDSRSALGAYMLNRFPGRVDIVQKVVDEQLVGTATTLVERAPGVHKKSHGVGTTVFLDHPLSSPHRILLGAVTTQRAGEGLRADASSLFSLVDAIYRTMADKRINEVVMPLLGAGHGGLKSEVALFCLLLAWANILCRPSGPRVSVRIMVYRKKPGDTPDPSPAVVRRIMRLAVQMND